MQYLVEQVTEDQKKAYLYFTFMKEEGFHILKNTNADVGVHIVVTARILEWEWWENARRDYALPSDVFFDTKTLHFYVERS